MLVFTVIIHNSRSFHWSHTSLVIVCVQGNSEMLYFAGLKISKVILETDRFEDRSPFLRLRGPTFEVNDLSDSATLSLLYSISYSWRSGHRPVKVRNFEFPVEILGRNSSFFPKIFPLLASNRHHFELCLLLWKFVPHTHTDKELKKKTKKKHVGISTEVAQLCLWVLRRQVTTQKHRAAMSAHTQTHTQTPKYPKGSSRRDQTSKAHSKPPY